MGDLTKISNVTVELLFTTVQLVYHLFIPIQMHVCNYNYLNSLIFVLSMYICFVASVVFVCTFTSKNNYDECQSLNHSFYQIYHYGI